MTTILLLTANPQNNAHLQLEKEIREIEQAIEHSKFGSQINFKPRRAVRLRDLLSHLENEQPYIVHFSGHGTESSELMLVDEQGNNSPLRKETIRQIFSLLKGKTRCVVLNACYTEPIANAIGENIDCVVVGMTGDVKDDTAIEFAREFYGQLANGKNVSSAFLLAKSHAPDDTTRLVNYRVDPTTVKIVPDEPVPSWWLRWSKVLASAAIALCIIALFVLMFWNQIITDPPVIPTLSPPPTPPLATTSPKPTSPASSAPSSISDPTVVITIGVVTAPNGSAFAIGEQQRKGIKIAEEYFYNKMGYKIVLIDGYSEEAKQKSELDGAKDAFNELVTEDVLAIIGPTLSSHALQVDHIANDKGIPVVAISNTHPKMRGFGDYILRISAGVEEFMPQVINHVAAHETVRKAIVLYLDEPIP